MRYVKPWIWNKLHWFVRKEKIDEYFDKLLDGKDIKIPKKEFDGTKRMVFTSGSTTGIQKPWSIDRAQLELRFATEWYGMVWAGWLPGECWGHLWYPLIYDSWWNNLKLKIANKLDRRLFFSYFNLNKKMSLNYAKKLNKKRATLLVGYSEAVYYMARYIEHKNIVFPFLKGIITSGGQLYPEWRETIEKVFGCKVYNRYGCSEFGCMAHEDYYGNMRVMAQRGITIKNDKDGKLLISDINLRSSPNKDVFIGDYGKVKDNILTEIKGKIKSDQSHLRIYR